METKIRVRTKPLNKINIRKLSVEALVMAFVFMPNYFNHPDGGLVSAARGELIRRGVIMETEDGMIEWDLDDETKKELADIFAVDNMLGMFRAITRVPRKRK